MPQLITYDAIIIGGGHNGLTAAAYLSKAGKKVLILERRNILGGAAVTEEIFPGFKFSVCSYVVSLLKTNIIKELMLPNFGLELLPLESTFTPLDGDYLLRTSDHDQTFQEIIDIPLKMLKLIYVLVPLWDRLAWQSVQYLRL